MQNESVQLSQVNADLVVQVKHLAVGHGDTRAFQAIDRFVNSSAKLTSVLFPQIATKLQTKFLLEDVESGTVTAWLEHQLSGADALRFSCEHREQIRKFFVEATVILNRWLNLPPSRGALDQLTTDLATKAAEREIETLFGSSPAKPLDILACAEMFQEVRSALSAEDEASIVAEGGRVQLDLSHNFGPRMLKEAAAGRSISNVADLLLTVLCVNYSGGEKWRFRHGSDEFSADVLDQRWVAEFVTRKIDIRPGDVLQALVRQQHVYTPVGELMDTSTSICSVSEVLTQSPSTLCSEDDALIGKLESAA